MRKRTFMIVLFLFFFLCSIPVWANSAPVYWEASPSSNVMIVEDNSPITVLKENLTFDFSENLLEDYSIVAKVTAEYTMKNTSENEITSSMVFPYFGNFSGSRKPGGQVLIDGSPVPYTLYYGDSYRKEDQEEDKLDLKAALEEVETGSYEPKNFSLDEPGVLYQVTFKNLKKDHFTGKVSFSLEGAEKVFAKNLNSYGYSGDSYDIGTSVRYQDTMEIFFLGEALDLMPEAHTFEGKELTENEDYTVEITKKGMLFQDYYEEMVADSEYLGYFVINNQTERNFFLKNLDDAFGAARLVTEDDLAQFLYEERLIFLYYETPFQAGEEKTISISYEAGGAMDRRSSKDPTYTFEYLLSPAGYFKDFKNLTLRVLPSEGYPFVISSSLPLDKKESGEYVGVFDTLPEKELTFTMYREEKITLVDRTEGFLSRNLYAFLFSGAVFLVFLAALVVGLGIRGLIRFKRHNR